MPNLEKQECHGTRNWRGFPFFSLKHWYEKETGKKKDKIKYNHRYPTRPCHVTSCQSSLQSHGKQEVLSQNCSTVPIQAVHGVPFVSPHCSLCPAASEGREEQGLGLRSPLAAYAGKLVMSSHEHSLWAETPTQPIPFSVTLPPWHCHCQELPPYPLFPFLKVTLSLKRKV